MSFQTVEQMQEMIDDLIKENEKLDHELQFLRFVIVGFEEKSKASVSNERTKIIAWLRKETWGIAAGCIEAGEHLK